MSKKCVLVTGGRDYGNMERVFQELDTLGPDLIIEGGALGADAHARKWAVERGVSYGIFPANWTKHDKAAGPLRNSTMVTVVKALGELGWKCTVLAFPGGRGTASCASIATDAMLLVKRITDEP